MSMEGDHNAQTQMTPLTEASQASPAPWVDYAESPYLLGPRIASGGMGSVHLGLKQGALGFRRLLAIKRLHGHLAQDPEFVARFKDEIRLVSRLNHPNIVQTFDVLETSNELALVMEYVEGVTLYQLVKDASTNGQRLPIEVVAGIVAQTLHGLHSAHELCDDNGRPLHLVHRDVSPQNIMVARDGLAKILDFGVAKAASETHVTRTGQLSGKAAYMSPEQAAGHGVDRRTDIFAAGVVLWEALAGQRLFRPPGIPEAVALKNVLEMRVKPPGEFRDDVPAALERVVLRALERDPTRRFGSARDFALAIEEAVPLASLSAVASGVTEISGPRIARLGASLPPQTHPDVESSPSGLGDWAKVPPRLVPLAMQTELTRPIEGVSVEGDQPQRSSRSTNLTIASMVGLALIAAVVFGAGVIGTAGQSESTTAPARGGETPSTVKQSWDQTQSPNKNLQPNGEERQPDNQAMKPVPPALNRPRPGVTHPTSASHTKYPTLANDAPMVSPPLVNATLVDSAAVKTTAAAAVADQNVAEAPPTEGSGAKNGARASKVNSKVAAASKKKTHTAKGASLAESKHSAKTSCSPPTYTDADGIRHFKPECL